MRKNFIGFVFLGFIYTFIQPASSIHLQDFIDNNVNPPIRRISIAYGTNVGQLPGNMPSTTCDLFDGFHRAYTAIRNQNAQQDPRIEFLFVNITQPHHIAATDLFTNRVNTAFSHNNTLQCYRNYDIH